LDNLPSVLSISEGQKCRSGFHKLILCSRFPQSLTFILHWCHIFDSPGVWTQSFSLLGRHSTTSVVTPVLFLLIIFEIRYCFFCLGQPGSQSYFKLPVIAGMTGVYHSGLRWYYINFLPGWPWPAILLISASSVALDDRHTPLFPGTGWDGVL
jgi:hypothetical protein